MLKRLRRSKAIGTKNQRTIYSYRYGTGEGSTGKVKTFVTQKQHRSGPQNLIDVLILKKQTVYQNEEKMRVLKEQDDKEWNEM